MFFREGGLRLRRHGTVFSFSRKIGSPSQFFVKKIWCLPLCQGAFTRLLVYHHMIETRGIMLIESTDNQRTEKKQTVR
jgi:hypothetical protein